MRIGAHVPVGKGYMHAVGYAAEVGCECLQIFAKSPQRWEGPPVDEEAASGFRRALIASDLSPLFTHAAYLIQLASEDARLRERSMVALADELGRASALGAQGVVCHVAAPAGLEAEQAARLVAESIAVSRSLVGASCDAPLLLENTAGAGGGFGSKLEHLGAILRALDPQVRRLTGVCLDTCHLHASGLDLSTTTGWSAALDELDRTCGPERLWLIHANDSLLAAGSRRDRHAWIGEGTIGENGFAALFTEERIAAVPIVIEMPGDPPVKDAENLARLRRLRDSCAAPSPGG